MNPFRLNIKRFGGLANVAPEGLVRFKLLVGENN